MRAVCEHCHSAQPADWQAGDLCVQCGQTVRRERRCHWCARLTPIGKFCRHCGSGLVEDALYGAARMLKAGGVDQFILPERLAAMPADQLEHLGRLYAPHERAVERHVDDLAFVEGFLRGRGWSGALEDTLLPQLPLAGEALHSLTLPPFRATTDLERLAEIRDGSPFAQSAQLAAVARVRLGAPRGEADSDTARAALASSDATVRAEAALALGNWRFIIGPPYAVQVRDLEAGLLEVHKANRSPEAGLGITLLKQQYSVWGTDITPGTLEGLLGGEDPDLAFGAALALDATDRLLPALHVPEQRYAAAVTLARTGAGLAEVGAVLGQMQPYEQERVLDRLRYRVGAVPALHDVLTRLLETTQDRALRNTASELLALENRPEDALRLIQANASLTNTVLQNPALEPSELERILVHLLETGRFNLYGLRALETIATEGRVSDAFVPALFEAANEYGWQELGNFARLQLIARADQDLHRFLWRVLESAMPEPARGRAWQALDGWYSQGAPPLRASLEAARWYFGGVTPLMERLCAVLEQPRLLERFYRLDEFLTRLLTDVDDDILPAMLEAGALLTRLRRNLWALARDNGRYSRNRAAALHLLGRVAPLPDDREALENDVRDLFLTDPPWDVRRAALEVLNRAEQTRLRSELQTLLQTPLSLEHREIAKVLLDDLEGVMRLHED
jgi:hypothetical protein